MSTRCNVVIKDKWDKFTLYHHHDGYPEGVGKKLLKCLDFILSDGRKLDAEYLTNWLIKNDTRQTGINDTEFEITPRLHIDIEYLYVIDCEKGDLKCYSISMNWETGRIKSKKEIVLAI